MVNLIITLIVALLIAGFVYWIWLKLKPIVAQFVAEPFMSLVDILILVLIGAVVIFYAVIPFLRAVLGAAGLN